MGIFAHDKGFWIIEGTNFIHLLHAWIHGRFDICNIIVSLVMYRAFLISFLNGIAACFEVHTGARFVSEGPDNDRGMVFIPLHHADHPVHMGFLPVHIMPQRGRFISHAMRFNVGFVNYINAVDIA